MIAPDGRHVLISGPGAAAGSFAAQAISEVYALPSGQLTGTPNIAGFDSVRAAWTPDSDALLVLSPFVGPTSELSGVLRRISVPDLVETVREFPGGAPQWPSTLSVSPDGARLVVGGSDGEVSLFVLDTLQLLAEFSGHQEFVAAVDWATGADQFLTLDRSRELIGWPFGSDAPAPASTDVGSTRFPGGYVRQPDGTWVVSTRNLDSSLGPIEVWDDVSARVVVSLEATDFVGLGPPGSAASLVAIGGREGIRIVDANSGGTVAEFSGTKGLPRGLSPDGEILVVSDEGFTAGEGFRSRLIGLSVSDEGELWNMPGVSAQDAIGFDPDGDTLFVTTGEWTPGSAVRGPELLVLDSATGEELASQPLRSGAFGGATVSPSGEFVAVFENGADDVGAFVYVFDVAALLDGEEALVAETELAGGVTPFGVAFSEDESTLYVPDGPLFGGEVLALAVDDGLEIRWSLVPGEVSTTPFVDDGLLWFPRQTSTSGIPRFEMVGVPSDVGEFAEWAATLPKRAFTGAECERYLGGPCDQVVSPPIG